MSIGDYAFGKPAKITANTYTGKSGIINIEREVDLSGSTHSKGVYILSGYLGEMFAQDIPLSLTASICFEQLYNGVDGDSESSGFWNYAWNQVPTGNNVWKTNLVGVYNNVTQVEPENELSTVSSATNSLSKSSKVFIIIGERVAKGVLDISNMFF